MKKIVTFTLLVLLVSLNSTSTLAFKSDTDLEQPQALLVDCPPGVPCDDNGGGGTYYGPPSGYYLEPREEESIESKSWWPTNVSAIDFNPSYYNNEHLHQPTEQDGKIFIKTGEFSYGSVCNDSYHLFIEEYPEVDGNTGFTSQYKDFKDSFYYGGRYYQYTSYYSAENSAGHFYKNLETKCQKYDVVNPTQQITNGNIIFKSYTIELEFGDGILAEGYEERNDYYYLNLSDISTMMQDIKEFYPLDEFDESRFVNWGSAFGLGVIGFVTTPAAAAVVGISFAQIIHDQSVADELEYMAYGELQILAIESELSTNVIEYHMVYRDDELYSITVTDKGNITEIDISYFLGYTAIDIMPSSEENILNIYEIIFNATTTDLDTFGEFLLKFEAFQDN